jgi:hypothetical protein
LIARIIERYDLNKDLDQKDHIYLVSPQFVEEKINKTMNILGEIGFTCRLGLFSIPPKIAAVTLGISQISLW